MNRLKGALRRCGENISSFEVESAILAHPAVRVVAVVGVPNKIAFQGLPLVTHQRLIARIGVIPVRRRWNGSVRLFDQGKVVVQLLADLPAAMLQASAAAAFWCEADAEMKTVALAVVIAQ